MYVLALKQCLCPFCCIFLEKRPKQSNRLIFCRQCGFGKMEKEIITLEDYLMGRDVTYASDFTKGLKDSALVLLARTNHLLFKLGIKSAKVNSGWRPKTLNDSVLGASKTSKHITCEAIDISDIGHEIYDKCQQNIEFLEARGLWLEHKQCTPTWLHLQTISPKSGNRFFKCGICKVCKNT